MPDEGSSEGFWGRLGAAFPFGAAPAVLLVAAAVALAIRLPLIPARSEAGRLVVWSFAAPHIAEYERIIAPFEKEHGVDVEFRNVHFEVIDRRLRSAMWAGKGIPDLVEIPLERVGSFFRGPVDEIGFADLSERVEDLGPAGIPIRDDVVLPRLLSYEHKGKLFGLPHDVHPMVMAYRWRVFEEAGIDPDSIETWDDFVEAGRLLTRRTRTRGSGVDDRRFMLAVDPVKCNVLQALVLQRGGNWFGEDGELIMDDEVVLDTLLWYTRIASGPERIADSAVAFPSMPFYEAIDSGYYVCFLCPDWLTKNIQDIVPDSSGEFRLMPLPAWEPGGRRASTWGATMLAMPTTGRDEDLAWELAKYLYVNGDIAEQTFREMNIMSPFRSTWENPVFAEERGFWDGQAIGEVYIGHADEVPVLRQGPFVPLVQQKVSDVMVSCTAYYGSRGEEGFEDFARSELKKAADYVRYQMRRNPF